LVSIRRADEAGYSTLFERGTCNILRRDSGETIGRIAETHGLYQVVTPNVEALVALAASGDEAAKSVLLNLEFHRVMGHISLTTSRDMVEKGRVSGIKLSDKCTDTQCPICIQAKVPRASIPKVAEGASATEYGRPTSYGDRVDADSWEPGWLSLGGNHHASLFTD
ncbi:hypothetical protein C8Q76DRAFT_599869, partial [Earliella scabrosa]